MKKKKIKTIFMIVVFILVATISNAILTGIIAKIRCVNYEEIEGDDSFVYQGNEYIRCRDLEIWSANDYSALNIIGYGKSNFFESILFHIHEYRMTSCADSDIIYMRYWIWPVNARRNPPCVYVQAGRINKLVVTIKYDFSNGMESSEENNNSISISYGELFSKPYSGLKKTETNKYICLIINCELHLYVYIYKGEDCLLFSTVHENAYNTFELPQELNNLLNLN